jgi:signal transduction histidine kinase/CheY-like chemotaxis protein
MPGSAETENRFRALLDIVRFAGEVAVQVHGAASRDEVMRLANAAFMASPHYFAGIMLLNEERTGLIVNEPVIGSAPDGGVRPHRYQVDIRNSSLLREVITEKRGVFADLSKVLAEILPAMLVNLLLKSFGEQSPKTVILVPLEHQGQEIGILAVLSPDLREEFMPFVVNLSRHIAIALETAETRAARPEVAELRADRMDSIGTLAGGIAHDFNNLLTGIVGNISLAKTYVKPDDKVYELLEESEKASLNAREVTSRLLTFAKGAAPVKRLVPIAELIRDWVTYSLRGSQTRTTFNLPEDLWPVEVDREQFGQVITNLVINADHAMHGAGKLAINVENAVIEAGAGDVAPGSYVKISIIDRGEGIAREHLDKIFNPYFTVGGLGHGQGLGLAITYSIVHRHGGYVTVDSEPGVGTTFFIYLPVAAVKPAPTPVPRTDSVAYKVLLVDNDESVRQVAGRILRHIGYQTVLAGDGAAAESKCRRATGGKTPFDAVIVDAAIEDEMDAGQIIARLREIAPALKVIVAVGGVDEASGGDASHYHAHALMSKPFTIDEMRQVLAEVLPLPKQE